ncbi:anthocyanidin 3-O-glucosyltransferase 5-like [Populus alba x Populus x berolinensis]|nr:anthocyanidin 3-O-glucosyltransferase 5-like [Populus alba x Populus x berolinensis]
MENTTGSKPHLVLLASLGIGHLIPILELGKRLFTHQNFDVTIFVVVSHSSAAESQVLQSAMTPKLCEIVELPTVNISRLVSPEAAVVTQICVIMREIKPALRSAISALSFRPAALIVDLFGSEAMVVADEFEMPRYVYVPSNAWFLALTIYVPILDEVVQGEYLDQKEPLKIPGCKAVQPEDVVDPMLDRTDQQYLEYVRTGMEIPKCDGILLNTWEDLEPKTLEALRDEELLGQLCKAPVYPVGPLTRPLKPLDSRSGELFLWLDKQPSESVIYVSFGSGGTLSLEQMVELAWGLELSQQRFVWVVRSPSRKTGDGCFFSAGSGEANSMASCFPEGFLDRIQEVGLVIKDWAPQVEILNHPSVGGFISHCGWNSTLESITTGVPLIAWPLYSEQRMNAALLTEELGVAVRPNILASDGMVGREEIEMMIRKITVDKEATNIRNRVKKLKHGAAETLRQGGSSHNALSLVAKQCEQSWKSMEVKAPWNA